MQNAIFVVAVEANYGQAGDNHYYNFFQTDIEDGDEGKTDEERVCFLWEGNADGGSGSGSSRSMASKPLADSVPGIWTSDRSKENMAISMEMLVSQRDICMHKRWFSFTAHNERDRTSMRHDFFQQMCNYVRIPVPGAKPGDKPKVKLSGKIGGNNDDACIAAQITLLSRRIFMSPGGIKKYGAWHKTHRDEPARTRRRPREESDPYNETSITKRMMSGSKTIVVH